MNEPFVVHEGIVAPLPIDNVDTDQIIPSREMKGVTKTGLGEGMFAGWRYTEPGGRTPDPAFVLNRPGYGDASIIVSGRNFGCGSSREHAVWALKEFGIKAIIAESYGEIFHNNCIRNGLLPITLAKVDVATLTAAAEDAVIKVSIDLPAQTVEVVDGKALAFAFDIDPAQKRMLVEGLDPIGLTLTESADITAFLERDTTERPWIYS